MGNAIQFGIYRIGLIIMGLVFLTSTSYSQELEKNDRAVAFENIKSLKNGALIVRLRINDKKVNAYKEAGNEKLAHKLEQKQAEKNLEMMEAFKEYFKFCPVYFIHADDYLPLFSGATSGFFVGDDLKIDSSITINELFFLFCDLGPVYSQVPIDQANPKFKQNTSTPAYQEGLVIKDHNFNQLLDPFPYHIKIRGGSFESAVKGLNGNLFQLMAKSWSKKK